jgi:hypothetical protein
MSQSAHVEPKNEVLMHFIILGGGQEACWACAYILVAGKDCKQSKSKILREYMHNQITPFAKYSQISKEEWAQFVWANVANYLYMTWHARM